MSEISYKSFRIVWHTKHKILVTLSVPLIFLESDDVMNINLKYFPTKNGANPEQAAAVNAALMSELEMEAKPASIIVAKNRACEFFIQNAKLRNHNHISCMTTLGLSSQKSMQFFNGEHKHVEFLRLLYAITVIGYDVTICIRRSDKPFGEIIFDGCN